MVDDTSPNDPLQIIYVGERPLSFQPADEHGRLLIWDPEVLSGRVANPISQVIEVVDGHAREVSVPVQFEGFNQESFSDFVSDPEE